MLALAIPVMLSNATTPLVGLVDTAVVGQLARPELIGGMVVGTTIFDILYGACFFLQLATIGFTAQASGAGRPRDIAANLLRPLLVAALLGLAIVVLRQPIVHIATSALGGSADVRATATAYFEARAFAAPATLAQMAVIGWLIGLGRTGIVFVLQLALNLLNMVLALWMVLGLGWGVTGAAIATAIAEAAAALGGLAVAVVIFRARRLETTIADVLAPAELWRALVTSRDITIRTLCISGVFAFFVSEGAKAGDVMLAANAALAKLAFVTVYLIDGFETAAQTLVGEAVGARDQDRYRRAVRLCFAWAGAVAVVLAMLIGVFGSGLIAVLTTSEAVRQAARAYLGWAALVPVAGIAAFILDGIFVGATRGRDLRDMMLLSTLIYAVAWAGLTHAFGNHGLWAALLVFFLVRAIALAARMPALEREAFGRG